MKLPEEFAFLNYPCPCALSSRGWGATIPGAPDILPAAFPGAGLGVGADPPQGCFSRHTELEIPVC